MRNPNDWHAKSFWSAEQWRDEADKYERLSAAAEADGDDHYAKMASVDAARCRQNARLKEIDQ